MSFREKTAWVTLFAIVFVSLLFWFHVPRLFMARSEHWVLMALAVSLASYLFIEAVAWLVLRLRNPRDAREPRDERERLIDLKALRIAHYVFVTAAFVGMFLSLHLVSGTTLTVFMAVLIAFVLSQIVKHVARILYFRRS